MAASAWRRQDGAGAIGAAATGWQFGFPAEPNHIDYVTTPVALNATGKTALAALFSIAGSAPVSTITWRPTTPVRHQRCAPLLPAGWRRHFWARQVRVLSLVVGDEII